LKRVSSPRKKVPAGGTRMPKNRINQLILNDFILYKYTHNGANTSALPPKKALERAKYG
jgi:hypothetical protein